jgi:RNA polymerase sigma-70 factor (ECF subfamily)
VARARDGGAALERLLEEIRPLVRRWALVKVRDPDCAADVTQRVLLTVHRGLDGFRDESGSFRTWLYRVTANAAVDEHRRRRRSTRLRDAMLRHAAAAGEAEVASRDPAGKVHERLDAVTVRRLVHRFAEELPDRQREVFDLVDLQGLDAGEVARMIGVAPSTARVHLMRARRRLRELLLESNPEIEEEYG